MNDNVMKVCFKVVLICFQSDKVLPALFPGLSLSLGGIEAEVSWEISPCGKKYSIIFHSILLLFSVY